MIIILRIIAVLVSFFLPEIVEGANWMFSWLIPGFWVLVFGLFWQRSKKAAEITLVLALVLGIIANLALPGEPGLFKAQKAAQRA
jgi:SSS family solute:Na+ symporter